jgi:predicted nuclease of predicted toxin-antitoxin system
VKFLVDAQLPRRLVRILAAAGHDVVHTLDLPLGNRTPDAEINRIALAEGRVVVTKDQDFVTSFLLRHEPQKLLLISTGNISNDALDRLLAAHLASVEAAFAQHRAFGQDSFVELSASAITIHC